MSYGWLTESTYVKKKENEIELIADKIAKANKHHKKNENSINELNSMVGSYLQNIKDKKKNPIGKKKLSYFEKVYNDKNEGVIKRNKKDKLGKLAITNKIINKTEKYEELKEKGTNDSLHLVNFKSKRKMEKKLEAIRKIKESNKKSIKE